MKTLTALAVALLAVAPLAAATPPNVINYQGVLRDAAGNPSNGSFDMVFRLFDQQIGGGQFLSDSHLLANGLAVSVTNGLFSVEIGSGLVTTAYPTLSAAFGAQGSIWLEIQVNAETLTPRLHFASAGYALNAATLEGKAASGFVNTSSQSQTKAGILLVGTAGSGPFASLADTGYGVIAKGSAAAGDFRESDTTAKAELAKDGVGVTASGPTYGAYFGKADFSAYAYLASNSSHGIQAYGATSGGYFANTNASTTATLATIAYNPYTWPDSYYPMGIDAQGEMGGQFASLNGQSHANVATGGLGIFALGLYGGGLFRDQNSSAEGTVAVDTYKIQGTGSVAFVQNHPTEKDQVVVYNAPEGDEVATYTRGSARLVAGEARIPLGETFAWVTNPDLGLTAYVTPVGEWSDLYVASQSTKELVVRSRDPQAGAVRLNYIVYGLRIGFEETSIVQRKHGEAFIPSMASHRSLYADHPELRRFNALERMKQEHGRMGLEATSDLRASTALREAIHEYDHETDKERLAAANSRFGPVRRATPGGGSDPRQSGITATSDAGQTRAALPDPRTGGLQGAGRDVAAMDDRRPGAGAPPVPSGLATPQGVTVSMSVGEPVEPGDVVAFDPERPGTLRRSAAADLGLAGVVAEDSPDVIPGEGPVSVTVVGIAMCKVDAAYGAIKAGDPLVASPTPGHAMRSLDPAAGAILGKAIDSLDAGTGRIRVLVLPR